MDFNLFGYKCIITNKIVIDKESIIEKDVLVDIVILKRITYFIFHTNTDLSLQ